MRSAKWHAFNRLFRLIVLNNFLEYSIPFFNNKLILGKQIYACICVNDLESLKRLFKPKSLITFYRWHFLLVIHEVNGVTYETKNMENKRKSHEEFI